MWRRRLTSTTCDVIRFGAVDCHFPTVSRQPFIKCLQNVCFESNLIQLIPSKLFKVAPIWMGCRRCHCTENHLFSSPPANAAKYKNRHKNKSYNEKRRSNLHSSAFWSTRSPDWFSIFNPRCSIISANKTKKKLLPLFTMYRINVRNFDLFVTCG